MIVIDSHLDLAWNALGWNRDLTRDIQEMRKAEAGMKDVGRGFNTVSLSEMRKGEVAVCLATVLARKSDLGELNLDFRSRELAFAMGQGQIAYYRILEKQGHLKMLRNLRDLREHMGKWLSEDHSTLPLGFILSMEGADPIISPGDMGEWWDNGLRVIGLAHFGRSAYAHGTGISGGLTPQGPDFLKAMQEAGMILDLTHLSEESFWEALNLFPGPVLASHNNCRALTPGDRQFTDDQIRELVRRDAVIGAVLDCWQILPDWKLGSTPTSLVSLEDVANHIDHICQLAGNARHAGIGSDLDGGFGTEQSPHDLETIADLQSLPAILRKRGYSNSDIEGVMHANWLRLFEQAWVKN
jgi:membrane dipeptidase